MKKIISIVTYLLSPIKENSVFFVFMYLLGVLTFMIETITLNFKIPRFNFLSLVVDLYLLCLILIITPRRIRPYLRFLFALVSYVLSVVDVFCVEMFRTKLGPEIVNVIIETDQRESGEFLSRYVNIDVLYSSVGLILLLLIIHLLVCYYWSAIRSRLYAISWVRYCCVSNYIRMAVLILIIVCFGFCLDSRWTLVRMLNAHDLVEIDGSISNFSENTPFNNVLFALKLRQLADAELGVLADNQNDMTVDSCSFQSDKMVLIIGESYIKCHSQLFGYNKETTPKQVERAQGQGNGLLFPFDDVITPFNLTSIVFKNVFSLHSVEDTTNWAKFPLFPVLFRKADYKVFLMTNQFVKSIKTDNFDTSGGLFLNDSRLSNLQFDYRNTSTHRYDEGLLHDYDSLKMFEGDHNLFIFHLIGQHIDFYKRSPDSWKKFNSSDYTDRNELSEAERQMVADYDNATLYNDYVIDCILKKFETEDAVVIHLPDHGDECYDELHRMGRLPGGSDYSPEVLRQEYQIPFWIWCSQSYMERHPIIIERIRMAQHLPFMIDDLPHLLLQLAGIRSPYYDESRSPISEKYNVRRTRLINGKCNYDMALKGSRISQ